MILSVILGALYRRQGLYEQANFLESYAPKSPSDPMIDQSSIDYSSTKSNQ